MADPKLEEIEAFRNFANTDAGTAVLWLRRYVDVESAIGAWFDNNQILPPADSAAIRDWDEGVFNADRNEAYGPENRPQPSFNIQSADALHAEPYNALNTGIFDATPSRPPSRVSTYAGNEDYSMQQAIKMSIDQRMEGQETGVTDGASGNFRRVQDAYHDTQNWAMTVPRFEARELVLGTEPKERARKEGAPAFLQPKYPSQLLAGLLTILHNIPMAKEALLARDLSIADYGNNSNWWDGDSIESSRLHVVGDGEEIPADSGLIYETQRLMAFLEMTTRAYGSVGNLIRERGVFSGSASVEANFLNAWRQAMDDANSESALKDVFRSVAVNDPREVADGNEAEVSLLELELTVTHKSMELGGSLYDAIDEMVWTEIDDLDPLMDVHLRFGEVLCIRVQSRKEGVTEMGLDVPAEFYPDRYHERFGDAVSPMRRRRVELITQISRIAEQLSKLAVVEDPLNVMTTHSGIWLLERTAEHFAATRERQSAVQPRRQDSDVLVDVDDTDRGFAYGDVEDELRALLVKLGERHNDLRQRQQRLIEELHAVTRSFREPSTYPASAPDLTRYTLRGVSTAPDTTYVLANPHTAEDLLDTAADEWQWWKLVHSSAPRTSTPATAHSVDLAAVLQAARTESTAVLLVYASDAAVAHGAEPLPPRLRNFARLDNLAFTRELDQADRGRGGARSAMSVSSSPASSDSGVSELGPRFRGRAGGENLPAAWAEFPEDDGDDDDDDDDDGDDGDGKAVNIHVSDDGMETDEPPSYEAAQAGQHGGADEKNEIDLLGDEPPPRAEEILPEERKGG